LSGNDRGLEDVEMHLLAQWMLREHGPDDRLYLREALHDLPSKGGPWGYSYVLIDCPPRLSTACINALAASDFLLIPVLLDATSARSVPNLLRMVRRLRAPHLFPDLNVLGIVANRVQLRIGVPIRQAADVWNQLPAVCNMAWGEPVHYFNTMVPNDNEFARA